jgi:uncharacterized RDD family membrane protein YckC
MTLDGDKRRYASLGVRLGALVIDTLLFCAVFFPVTRLVKGVWFMGAADHRWSVGLLITDPLCLAFLAVMVGYFVLLEGLLGATLGKWVLGLRVVPVYNADGLPPVAARRGAVSGEDSGRHRADSGPVRFRRPGLVRSALRNLLRLVDGLPAFSMLGVILILRSPENARFGDRVGGTRVVRASSGRD